MSCCVRRSLLSRFLVARNSLGKVRWSSAVVESQPQPDDIPVNDDNQGRFPRELWRVNSTKNNVTPQSWVTSLDDVTGRNVDLIDLHPAVFRHAPRMDLLARNLDWQRKYKTVSFMKARSKAEMPGVKKKPHPQKGTGRARAGSIYGPQWHGGGVAHGARGPRTNFFMLPDSIRLAGLCVCLTVKHVQDDLIIVDSFDKLPHESPKFLQDIAEARNWGYSVLFVDEGDIAARNLALASAEIDGFDILPSYGLNCQSMVKYETLVLTRRALQQIETKIVQQLNRASGLHSKFKYMDMKETLLNEGENEEDSHVPPFV